MSRTMLEQSRPRLIVGSEIDTDVAALEYWLSQPMAVRLAAVDQLREEHHRWSGIDESGLERTACLVAVQ